MSAVEVSSDVRSLDNVSYTSLSDLRNSISSNTASKLAGLQRTDSFNTVFSSEVVGTVAYLTLEVLKVELQNRLEQIKEELQGLRIRNIAIKKPARICRVVGGIIASGGIVGSIFGAKKINDAEDGNVIEGAIVFVVGMLFSIGIGSICWCCNETVIERNWVQHQITVLEKEKAILTQCKTDATFLNFVYNMYREAENSGNVELKGENFPFVNFLQRNQGLFMNLS